MEPLPAYSARHLDPEEAARYRTKFRRGPLRRLSARRERALVRRALVEALALVPADRRAAPRVLDLPCGAGRFAPLLAELAGPAAEVLLGDHSPHMGALAVAALAAAGRPPAGLLVGDARRLGLADGAVDLCLSMRLLHHFPSPADRGAILGELARVTRGPVVTSFLDRSSFKQRRHLARVAARGNATRRVLLTPAEFEAEARGAGLGLRWSRPLSGLFSGQRVALLVPLG